MKSIWIVFAVVAFVAISCSATETPEQTNEPPSTRKQEIVDRLANVHTNQAVMQPPPSFEGVHLRLCLGGAQRYLTEGV